MDKRYTLYDYYEGDIEILNDCIRTPNDAYSIAYERIADTDGECNICFKPTTPASVDPILEKKIEDAISEAYDDYEADLTAQEMINSINGINGLNY